MAEMELKEVLTYINTLDEGELSEVLKQTLRRMEEIRQLKRPTTPIDEAWRNVTKDLELTPSNKDVIFLRDTVIEYLASDDKSVDRALIHTAVRKCAELADVKNSIMHVSKEVQSVLTGIALKVNPEREKIAKKYFECNQMRMNNIEEFIVAIAKTMQHDYF